MKEISHTHATPELVFRYGITDRIEVALRFNYVWRFFDTEEDVENEDSAEDMRLALKFETSEQCGWRPRTAVDARITVPTGGSSWTTDDVEVGMRLIYAWELGERIELSGSSGFGHQRRRRRRVPGGQPGERRRLHSLVHVGRDGVSA